MGGVHVWQGKSTLGLAYGLILSEAMISPAMPSTTARAGGVYLPIISSLGNNAGSMPNDPSARKLSGTYLTSRPIRTHGSCVLCGPGWKSANQHTLPTPFTSPFTSPAPASAPTPPPALAGVTRE
jgi:hypothetical protein